MAVDVLERVGELQAEREDLMAMHFGAMRVLDSTRGGGRGTFRVDGLSEEQVEGLSDYIGQYIGERIPHLYFNEDGSLGQCGGSLVREEDTKFSMVNRWVDEETGESRTWLRWNRELWDSEVAEQTKMQELAQNRRSRLIKYASRTAIGLAMAVEVLSFCMIFKGTHDEAEAKRQGLEATQIAEAQDLTDAGLKMLGTIPPTAGLVLIGATLHDLRKRKKA